MHPVLARLWLRREAYSSHLEGEVWAYMHSVWSFTAAWLKTLVLDQNDTAVCHLDSVEAWKSSCFWRAGNKPRVLKHGSPRPNTNVSQAVWRCYMVKIEQALSSLPYSIHRVKKPMDSCIWKLTCFTPVFTSLAVTTFTLYEILYIFFLTQWALYNSRQVISPF